MIAARLMYASLLALLLVTSTLSVWPDADGDGALKATASQVGESPVAVIGHLPDAVSNGTQWTLSATQSYDPDGFIVTHLWKITYGDTTEYLQGVGELYRFRMLGLYKITLTVTDNQGNEAMNFTAVYSVPDSDSDGLPDWWEVKHFNGLLALPDSDPDGDGYSNLEEYVHGTNPLVPDPGQGFLEENWRVLLVGAVLAAGLVAAYLPWHRRRRQDRERKKIEYAVEIEKALEDEE